MTSQPLAIKNGRVIDPAQDLDRTCDVLLEDGRVAAVDPGLGLGTEGRQVVDASGLWVLPGLIDAHVHLREPGHEYKEDLASGLAAAAAGGFTAVLAMPNTSPPVDQAGLVASLLSRARGLRGARLLQSAAMTRGLRGQELTEYAELREAGAVAVTDDGRWVADSAVMRRVLCYARVCGLAALSHAQEGPLSDGGQIHEGRVSTRLGLRGIPAEAEAVAVYRDLALARLTGAPVHVCHVSSALSLDLVRRFKAGGTRVTCETAPHYLFLTDEDVAGYDTCRKMNPPLRTAADLGALREGIRDGTIDLVATDHAPHSVLEKEVEFMDAAFGVIGLETALPLIHGLMAELSLPPSRLVELMSLRPAGLLGLPLGTLRPGSAADLTLFDPQAAFKYDVGTSLSKSRNSPFQGREMRGRVVRTVVGGQTVFAAGTGSLG
ncbi:MAG: dihydroorotase [Deltaproteobacteria bacterium]|jgi:dihydroorotase|nr:dihydroorotase [Deltaproteobacteria bacterium]